MPQRTPRCQPRASPAPWVAEGERERREPRRLVVRRLFRHAGLLRILDMRLAPRVRPSCGVAVCALLAATAPAAAQQPPNWVGSIRCDLQGQGPGYSHQEAQTWTLTGNPPVLQGSVRAYPATWTVTGQGSFDRTRNNFRRIAQWTVALPASMSAPIGFTLTPSGQLEITKWHAQITAPGSYSGTDQNINDGVPQAPRGLAQTLYEWQFPKIEVPASQTRITGSRTYDVRTQIGPLQPDDAVATISCAWSFGQGAATALPAPPAPGTGSSSTGSGGAPAGGLGGGAAAGGNAGSTAGGGAVGSANGGSAAGAGSAGTGSGVGTAAGGAPAAGGATSGAPGGAGGGGGGGAVAGGGAPAGGATGGAPAAGGAASGAPAAASQIAAAANVSVNPPSITTVAVTPTGPLTDQWWHVLAQDNPAATTAQLQVTASAANLPAGLSYDIEIIEQTPSGRAVRALSGTSQTPRASLIWPNVPGADDTRTFLVRLRQATGATGVTGFSLTIALGGPAPSAPVSTTVVPIVPVVAGTLGSPPAATPPPATTVPLVPPVTTAPTSGTYRVSVVGFSVRRDTGNGNNDGAGDEIYVAVHARGADRRMFTSAWRDTPNSIGQPGPTLARTRTFGDVNRFPTRTQLGSASATGGLRASDNVTLPEVLVAWEGTLRDGVDVVFIKPSVWEDDGERADFNAWILSNNSFVGTDAATIAAAASAQSLQFVEEPVGHTSSSGWPGDRPIGMRGCTNCASSYRDRILILTRERVEASLASNPSGTFALTLTDMGGGRGSFPTYAPFAAEYVVALRIARVP